MTDDATLYSGGLVFDGLNTPTGGQAVLVENGRITKVAPADSFQGFAGQTVDTTGATLMPGLIDCHVHICHKDLGSTTPNIKRGATDDGRRRRLAAATQAAGDDNDAGHATGDEHAEAPRELPRLHFVGFPL